jgi:hypothetical protein
MFNLNLTGLEKFTIEKLAKILEEFTSRHVIALDQLPKYTILKYVK